jgi:carboxyl-terminal processing protease
MNLLTRNVFVLTLGAIIGLSLAIGRGVLAERTEATAQLPLEELRLFSEVFSRIKSDFVEPVDDKTLLENAIRGMLSGLDPHSTYLSEAEFKELRIGTTGEFGGLGIEVGMENGFVKVIAPIDDTPAERAGVEAGDLIIRLDDAPVKGLSLNDAVKIMRGKPGTKIQLTIVRDGEEKPLKITIVRDVIKVQSIKSRMLEDGFGYIRVTQFQSKTGESLIKAVDKLRKESEGELKGIVLDLRNNPGGVLSAAVAVSDAFLDKGLIVYTKGRVKDSRLRFQAKPSDVLKGAPIVVLVNGGSASASEIVAGALQDHKRAVVIGSKTFGKGSVQTILPLKENTALKLTTARYYTPLGRSIQAEGIEPDILLENLKVASVEASAVDRLKEADLQRHLSNGNVDTKEKDKRPANENKDDQESLASTDYPLYEALNILKGLYFLQASAQ